MENAVDFLSIVISRAWETYLRAPFAPLAGANDDLSKGYDSALIRAERRESLRATALR
jgi:hypothetical protein